MRGSPRVSVNSVNGRSAGSPWGLDQAVPWDVHGQVLMAFGSSPESCAIPQRDSQHQPSRPALTGTQSLGTQQVSTRCLRKSLIMSLRAGWSNMDGM